jgi:hypothetical protein
MKLKVTLLLYLLIGQMALCPAQAASKAQSPSSAKAKPGKAGGRNTVVKQMRSPPAAKLAEGHETLLESGCLDLAQIKEIKTRLQLQVSAEPSAMVSSSPNGTCIPYSAAKTAPLVRNALVLLSPEQTEEPFNALLYSRTAVASTATQTPWQFKPDSAKLRQITTSNLRSDGVDQQEIPSQLQWQVDVMAKLMISALQVDPSMHHLRITLTPEGASATEKIFAIELVESASGNRAELAVWLERDNIPGAFFSMRGLDYERMLWKSPVQFTRISRGVGPSVTTVTRRVAVKSRKKAKPRMVVRTLKVKGHHIGIDFAAPTGTPVVAVADGEIAHAAVHGGYGNLIIIDHGQGHHTYYAHLSAFVSDIQPGTLVRRGEEIGYVGSTGFSTGPHLHFEIRKDGLFVNPEVKDNKLKFWTLDAQEQPQILDRLLQLQTVVAPQMAAPRLGP